MKQENLVEIENFYNLFYIGSWSIIEILVVLIALDVLSGMIKATKEHSVKSSIANIGLAKKVAILVVIVVANLTDLFFKANGMIVNGTVAFYILGEAISVLENCVVIGVPIPDVIKKRLGMTDEEPKQ